MQKKKILLFFLFFLQLLGSAGAATCSSIFQFGITWSFDKAYECGQFANGDNWVIGPITITGISPASIIDGTGRTINGSMINPTIQQKQGYDSHAGNYVASSNVARKNNNPISPTNTLAVPINSSLVSSIGLDSSHPLFSSTSVKAAAVLTVLSSVPLIGSFRPQYAGTDKSIKFNKSQLNYSLLKSLAPVANTLVLHKDILLDPSDQDETVERYFERPWIDIWTNAGYDQVHPTENMRHYGRDLSTQIGEGALMLNLNFSNAQKETLFVRFTQLGIDLYGAYLAGASWEPDGGEGEGRKFPILFAGWALNDSAMASIGSHAFNDPLFQEDAQSFYVSQSDVSSGRYDSQQLGLPEYGVRHATFPEYDSPVWETGYRTCCTANSWAGIILSVLIMGKKSEWKHNALFDYQDRYMEISKSLGQTGEWKRQWSRFSETMWDTYRANYGCIWTRDNPNDITSLGHYENCAECVDMPKLVNYIAQWKSGQLTMTVLVQKITAWKSGTGC